MGGRAPDEVIEEHRDGVAEGSPNQTRQKGCKDRAGGCCSGMTGVLGQAVGLLLLGGGLGLTAGEGINPCHAAMGLGLGGAHIGSLFAILQRV